MCHVGDFEIVGVDGGGLQLTLESAAQMISPDIFDPVVCRHMMIKYTRGESPACPQCGELLNGSDLERLFDGKAITCRCGVMSSPRSGTILEGSPLTDAQIVFILAMLYWDFPASKIADMAGCTRATVYNWRNRIQGAC